MFPEGTLRLHQDDLLCLTAAEISYALFSKEHMITFVESYHFFYFANLLISFW